MDDFALVSLVGPDPADLSRLEELVQSLAAVEEQPCAHLLIDDNRSWRDLAARIPAPKNWPFIALQNPRDGRGFDHWGGMCCGVLLGMGWVVENTRARFALK